MRKKLHFRYWLSFIILIVLLLVFIFWNINSGSISISLKDIFQILFHKNGDETAYNIVWEIRLPRILAAVILGGALSVSGFLLQTFFGNPIAGPFVLGISSGAKLIVALTMIYLLGKSMVATSGLMILAAFTGSLISMGFVLLISRKVKQMSMLVVSGIMIGYICSAITDFVVTFADDSNIVNLHNWSLGSFSGTSWDNVSVMAVVVFAALFLTFLMSKPISAYQLGEGYAQNMGVNIKAFRIALILLSRWSFLVEDYGMSSRYALQFQVGVVGILLTLALCWKECQKAGRQVIWRGVAVLVTAIFLLGNITTTRKELQTAPYRKELCVKRAETALDFENKTDDELRAEFEFRTSWDQSGAMVRSALIILKENHWNVFHQ